MSYIDAIVAPVAAGVTREQYREFAAATAGVFLDNGAIRSFDAWADDVPHGEVTDFYKAVGIEDGEGLAVGFIEWPDKATRDAGMAKAMQDPRMQPGEGSPMPIVGKRMIFGGFATLHDQKGA